MNSSSGSGFLQTAGGHAAALSIMSATIREPTPEEIEKMSAKLPRGTSTQKQREAAISTAMARPMPRAAPVTTATLSCSMEPRPGRMGPALRSVGGSGIGLPSRTLGA